MSNDHIPLPEFLKPLVEGFNDPYPLHSDFVEPGPLIAGVIVNPGFSKKLEAWENARRWQTEGHYVVCYLPVESSTELGFRIAKAEQNGEAVRMTFHKRPYKGCRDIELIILPPKEKPQRTEET